MIRDTPLSRPRAALESVVSRLNQTLPTTGYVIPAADDYTAFTNNPSDIYCVETKLGQSAINADYTTYAVAQTFSPDYPSLVLTFVVDLRNSDRQPAPHLTKIDQRIDGKLSTIFLPAIFTAFNKLDPTGCGRGVVVQSYHAGMALGDLIHGSVYTIQLLQRFKRDGQLAIIAVDFDDPILLAMSGIINAGASLIGGDIHLLRRTRQQSSIQMPILREEGGYYRVAGNSSALDEGLNKARWYLDTHVQSLPSRVR